MLDYVKAHVPAGETCTVLIDARIVTWYDPARVYRQWRFHDLPFLLATNGEFDLEGDAAYFREELVKAGVQYVYSSPQRKTRPHFWDEVLSHPDHFERVLTIDGASLSRVRANVLDPAGGVE